MRGDSLSSMNSAASFLRSFCVFGSSAPCLAIAASACCSSLRDRGHAARDFFRIRAGIDGLFLGLVAVLGVLFLVLGVRLEVDLGRVLRLRDDVGRVRVDEADHEVDQARLAGLDES